MKNSKKMIASSTVAKLRMMMNNALHQAKKVRTALRDKAIASLKSCDTRSALRSG